MKAMEAVCHLLDHLQHLKRGKNQTLLLAVTFVASLPCGSWTLFVGVLNSRKEFF